MSPDDAVVLTDYRHKDKNLYYLIFTYNLGQAVIYVGFLYLYQECSELTKLN